MHFRVAQFGEMYERGVWLAPWLGDNGEFILVAVTSRRRKVAEETVPLAADHAAAAARLYEILDRIEPESRANLKVV
jgi:hypothetical protein